MKKGNKVYVPENRLSELDLVGIGPCEVLKVYSGDYDKERKEHLVRVVYNDHQFVCRVTSKSIVR